MQPPAWPEDRIDYGTVAEFKQHVLNEACRRFKQRLPDEGYTRFCAQNATWLDDYALFTALCARYPDTAWNQWPPELHRRQPETLTILQTDLGSLLEDLKIGQYFFHQQWIELRAYCLARGIRILGDLPIYVPFRCTDVWAHPHLFKLNEAGVSLAVSGVPPDYFSADGQLWGHPVYRWEAHQHDRYEWWVRRLAHHLALCDYVRIDHFRGLVAYWEIPAGESTAANGRWVPTPVEDFFGELRRRFVCLPLIAEDLGYITADVRETMQRWGFPGMRVLLFGFSGEPGANDNAFFNVTENCVVFTGTHDNNTARGWFENEASALEKHRLAITLGHEPIAADLPWDLVRLALMSPARLCILPVQDLLGLGPEARINSPGRRKNNWQWRMTGEQFAALPLKRLLEMTEAFARL